ncbi:MAG TPA: hypothetical protein VFM21_05995 [Terriglobia bacterium]|nr:hypothetical protein [Terriglobia bacterium]
MFGRHSLRISILVLGVFLFAAAAAFADNVRNLSLPANVVLQGTHLQAGEYTITWYHHSPRLTVKISNAKKVLVTASATLIDQKKIYERDTFVVNTRTDGTRTLRAIGFAGSSQAIVFDAGASEPRYMLPSTSLGDAQFAPGNASNGAQRRMAR